MILRYTAAIVIGGLVTLGVLFTMQVLIATPQSRLDESGTRHFVDFVRVEPEATLQRKDRKREKPPEPEPPPLEAAPPRVDSVDPEQITVDIPVASVGLEMSIESLGLVASDGEYLPLVKFIPIYPPRAQTRGIEGYCLLEYTVTAAGTVKDVVVIESQPKGVFDKTSISAVLKFKYVPKVVNGEPIEVRNVPIRYLFELETEP